MLTSNLLIVYGFICGICVGCLVEMFKRSIVIILGTLEVDVNGEK